MKTGIEIANNFTYLYKNLDYMKDHDNFDLFEKITKKSSPLFVKGGDIISRNPLVAGYHEIDTEELIRTYRGNGYSDFLIDIGANIGLTTCFSGKGFSNIFCFEPNPQVFRILQTNVEITFGLDNKVVLNNFGLGDSDTELELTIPKNNYGGAYIKQGNTYSNDILLQKDNITDPSNAYDYIGVSIKNAEEQLGQLFADIPVGSKGVIKIDVEGYEPYVLEAIGKALPENNSYAIIFENHDPSMTILEFQKFFNRDIVLYRLHHYPIRKFKLLRKIKSYLGATGKHTLEKVDKKDCTGQLLLVLDSST
ncbi:FkbM family methyltransferase [Candidatus Thioglobus autotrophicus]|jgi:FkbM family methyltransferase|uniref:FkbM family methyltransferase n=1 Tax=Candidatus Thioglobus autotrophicus TaxID=1705394 RepID=UPI00299E09F8|nr:FkbM family methyltransferase [Candidatus Thioglobus autotrophicus]WPE17784.1 FkbM family methyltransferase [Candidatus Thioglobus autotrophicus]